MTQTTSISAPTRPLQKIEPPLDSDPQFFELVKRFEACDLPIVNWTHRAHLAVGLVYLGQMTFDAATLRLRERIQAYNRASGNPPGYNETVTLLFLRKIKSVTTAQATPTALHEQLNTLEDICGITWIYQYYSKQLIWSDEAKSRWTAPDLRPLDF